MTVRRHRDDKMVGYGSFGAIRNATMNIITYDLREESMNILPFLPQSSDSENPYVRYYIGIHWRWKFIALTWDDERTQKYNARIGKMKLGTALISTQGYISDEIFISYEEQISPLYFAHLRYDISETGDQLNIDDSIPCDEPPSDSQLPVISSAVWHNLGFLSENGKYSNTLPNTLSGIIGERIDFYPEKSLKLYNLGGSYQYFIKPKQSWEVEEEGDAPFIFV